MLRKTLTILSLVGLVVSVGLWGLSYSTVVWGAPSKEVALFLSRGRMVAFTGTAAKLTHAMMNRYIHRRELELFVFHRFKSGRLPEYRALYRYPIQDFWVGPLAEPRELVGRELYMPLYLLIIPFVVLQVFFRPHPVRAFRRRHRRKLGLCLKCGYDLRGSTDQCPECNTPIEP